MRQIQTSSTLPPGVRNGIVRGNRIRCQALDCERPATRWSNLCGLCERQWLEDMRPVFGAPDASQLRCAGGLLRRHFAADIRVGTFDAWASSIGRNLDRSASCIQSPLRLRYLRRPRDRMDTLLAWRTRDRGLPGRTAILNLTAFALVTDACFTRAIPSPVRRDYMIALLGRRFLGRTVYSRTALRLRTRIEKTGWTICGPDGPIEQTRRIEEEVPVTEHYPLRRADYRLIGRRVWGQLEANLLAGGRNGGEWRGLQDGLLLSLSQIGGASR